jgi:hypothetical protein
MATDDTVSAFFSTIASFTAGTSDTPTTVNTLINTIFCPADNSTNPPSPSVGITTHGPNFIGVPDVTLLFTQLFSSFPDISLTEVNKKRRMDSRNGAPAVMIATPTYLQGTYSVKWFAKDPSKKDSESHYSKPLSDIIPGSPNSKFLQTKKIPAYAVFSFASAAAPTLISQLSLYLDRYSFIRDLHPASDGTTQGFTFMDVGE